MSWLRRRSPTTAPACSGYGETFEVFNVAIEAGKRSFADIQHDDLGKQFVNELEACELP
ncbi:MAG TPA: hypothetical protein VJ255_16145 [Candidatus Acidoferrum sp.]|jgi:hypothetical protein|nr:hypothetical protein [Candidatus Acidoferrum sp.]